MTMREDFHMRGDFRRTFIPTLRQRIEREGRVLLSVDQIIAETHSVDPRIHGRSFWRANQVGVRRYYDGFANAGIALELIPDEHGQPVASVAFTIANANS